MSSRRLLGFEAQRIIGQNLNENLFLLEDDLVLSDPLFFDKQNILIQPLAPFFIALGLNNLTPQSVDILYIDGPIEPLSLFLHENRIPR